MVLIIINSCYNIIKDPSIISDAIDNFINNYNSEPIPEPKMYYFVEEDGSLLKNDIIEKEKEQHDDKKDKSGLIGALIAISSFIIGCLII